MNKDLQLSFRRMASIDLDRVVQLDRLSFSLPWPESSFRFEITENDASRCWVAEIPGKNDLPLIVGMIVLWLIIDEVHIATIAVDPEVRRQGIAQQLLAFTLADACRAGGNKAFLEVRKGNLAARSLYEKFGFTEIGIRQNYYQDNGEDAVMMNLEKLEISLLESLL